MTCADVKRLKELECMVVDLKLRNRLLRDRLDLPVERLEAYRYAVKKGFWSGFEIARMNPDSNDINHHFIGYMKLKQNKTNT